MDIDPLIHNLFGRCQHLLLLILREDLRRGLVARGYWLDGGYLCPLAHGLADGIEIEQLRWQSQAIGLKQACYGAARYLGALPSEVYRFVELWDQSSRQNWLLEQLDDLWQERLADAESVQSFLDEKCCRAVSEGTNSGEVSGLVLARSTAY